MLKRKSHTKSRRGCTNCKTRRIKCDETGPPCANCAARTWSTEKCTYGAVPPRLPDRNKLPSRPHNPNPTATATTLTATPTLLSPTSFSSTAPGDRLLELELLHRWSTRTWTAFFAIPECEPYLLDHLPRQALQHNYLLYAIFASAAMDLAISSSSSPSSNSPSYSASPSSSSSSYTHSPSRSHYLRAALEYGTLASASFRSQVHTVTPSNIDLVTYFSSMASIVSFVAPPVPNEPIPTALERIIALVDTLLASARISMLQVQWLLDSPCPARAIARGYSVNLSLMEGLDPSTKIAIELLTSVCKQVYLPDGRAAKDVFAYNVAVGQTKYSFAEEQVGRMQKYYATLFPIAGDEFAAALKAREPMALFVIMYWGVLVENAAHREWGAWTVGETGKQLVEEISEILLASQFSEIPGVCEGIAWTRCQVGLPPLLGCVLPAGLSGVVSEEGCSENELQALMGSTDLSSDWELAVLGPPTEEVELQYVH